MIRFGTLDFGDKERKAIDELIGEKEPQLTMGKYVYEFALLFLFFSCLFICYVQFEAINLIASISTITLISKKIKNSSNMKMG